MRKQNILKGCAVATLFLTQIAYADFTFYSSTPDACEHLAGHWSGTGTASNWAIGECVYHGVGVISPLDKAGNFTVEVVSHKDSGSFFCPSHSEKHLTGTCVNGVTIIHTEYGDISGDFSQNSGTAQGTLSITPALRVNVVMQFDRDN
ncbi:hypothetical protein [Legionella rowbothamii]|uniref:hypothetical protein n=1 Tax=Legionella rowbothamii TaxID=96229 RepID=UPI001055E037|nr:hypothetical protein [Legionella rowbothamii]